MFAEPGPWSVLVGDPWAGRGGYVRTPTDDPAFLYQNTLIVLDASRGINIGEPSLHPHCLDALALRPGKVVLQVGAGAGYCTALLGHLIGADGRVHAYGIAPEMAARRTQPFRLPPGQPAPPLGHRRRPA